MAWIELHQELPGHHKTRRLARGLGISRAQAVGHLACLWMWALDHAGDDGDLSRFADDDLAEEAGWPGEPGEFMSALREAGFVDGSVIHDWPDYAGRLIAQRQANRDRARTSRARHAHVTGLPDLTQPDQTEPEELFVTFWTAFPRKVGKRAARTAFERALKRASAEVICEGARRYADDPNRTDEFTAHPTTWLNRDGWEDAALPARGNVRDLRPSERLALRESS